MTVTYDAIGAGYGPGFDVGPGAFSKNTTLTPGPTDILIVEIQMANATGAAMTATLNGATLIARESVNALVPPENWVGGGTNDRMTVEWWWMHDPTWDDVTVVTLTGTANAARYDMQAFEFSGCSDLVAPIVGTPDTYSRTLTPGPAMGAFSHTLSVVGRGAVMYRGVHGPGAVNAWSGITAGGDMPTQGGTVTQTITEANTGNESTVAVLFLLAAGVDGLTWGHPFGVDGIHPV